MATSAQPPQPHSVETPGDLYKWHDYSELLASAQRVVALPQHDPPPSGRCGPCEAWLKYPYDEGTREYELTFHGGGKAVGTGTIIGHKHGCCKYRYTLQSSGKDLLYCEEPNDFRTKACNPRTAKQSKNVFLAVCGPRLVWQVRVPEGKALGQLRDFPHAQDHYAQDTMLLVVPDGEARAKYVVRPETPGQGEETRLNGPIKIGIFAEGGDTLVGSMHCRDYDELEVIFPSNASSEHKALLLAGLMFWDRHRWRPEFDDRDLLDAVGRIPLGGGGGGNMIGNANGGRKQGRRKGGKGGPRVRGGGAGGRGGILMGAFGTGMMAAL